MVTPQPKFDMSQDHFQQQRDAFESTFFPDLAALDRIDQETSDAYLSERAKVLIRSVTRYLLEQGQTQQDLAAMLGVDRSVINVAVNSGDLGGRPLANLIGSPVVHAQLMARSRPLRCEMARAAFIGGAKVVAGAVGAPKNEIDALDEVRYEACALLIDVGCGYELDPDVAGATLAQWAKSSPMHLVPAWVKEDGRTAAKNWLSALSDPRFARGEATRLQNRWLEVFRYTWALTEGLGDSDLWDEDGGSASPIQQVSPPSPALSGRLSLAALATA